MRQTLSDRCLLSGIRISRFALNLLHASYERYQIEKNAEPHDRVAPEETRKSIWNDFHKFSLLLTRRLQICLSLKRSHSEANPDKHGLKKNQSKDAAPESYAIVWMREAANDNFFWVELRNVRQKIY